VEATEVAADAAKAQAGAKPTITTAMTSLDFDGDYGRTYARTIRNSIPAYDALLEIATAALAANGTAASSALVVGPGLGEELPGMLAALPEATFTLLEPSEQMARGCASVIAREGAGDRCRLLALRLEEAGPLEGEPFDVVVCHHVLHLMHPEQQRQALGQLCARVKAGGLLLLSSYSEPADAETCDRMLAIGQSRLRQLGMAEETLRQFMAGRNTLVFSLDQSLLAEELAAAGLEPPLPLLQALGSRMWLSRRP
jgi:tRNA (cmo5U34)-methyltransferase